MEITGILKVELVLSFLMWFCRCAENPFLLFTPTYFLHSFSLVNSGGSLAKHLQDPLLASLAKQIPISKEAGGPSASEV